MKKKLFWFLLLFVPGIVLGQGTGTAGIPFRIGAPATTLSIHDSLVARDVSWIDSTEARGIAGLQENLTVTDTLSTNEAAIDTIWATNGHLYIKDSLWVKENLTVQDTLWLGSASYGYIWNHSAFSAITYKSKRNHYFYLDTDNNDATESFAVLAYSGGAALFSVDGTNAGNTIVGGNLTVTDTTTTAFLTVTGKATVDTLIASLGRIFVGADSTDTTYIQRVKIGNYLLPVQDGTANYVLKTNGSGVVSWQPDTTSVVLDTLPANKSGNGQYLWGHSGAVTRPGFFYKITGKNTWTLVDTSVVSRASGVAMDSVAANIACRFLFKGTYRKDDWLKFPPGSAIFSDSATTGLPNVGGQAAPKKMQFYGTAIDSSVILIDIDNTITQ